MEIESQQTEATPELPPEAVEGATEEVSAATGSEEIEYEPNFGFKVQDEELEIPEWARPIVKDADSEKQVRDIFERAYGLDHVKADRTTLREENTTLKSHNTELTQRNEQIVGTLQKIESFKQQGDWDSYFEALGVPRDALLRHSQKLVETLQDPQKAQAYNDSRNQFWSGQQVQDSNAQLQNQMAQMREQQVDMLIMNPMYAQAAQEFDQRLGQPGAFKDHIWRHGQMMWHTNQVDLSPVEAANEVLKIAGITPMQQQSTQHMMPPASQAPGQGLQNQTLAPGGQPSAPQPVAQARPPVLPNQSGGGGSSPIKTTPNSIQDLRRIRSSMG